MKESISIIFAGIIGTFLIVILPLYSILDRQDSMSYNVVLTATTNFVDNVRNNGFIDRNSYNEYLAKLASTANTYKVNLEVYKNILINDVDENGNVIADSYVEEKELYNTQDILAAIDAENIDDAKNSNIKNNAYLLSENDEIYVRIHNTNITTGSMLYSILSDTTNTEVINISYGGVINKVNWELYDKINTEVALAPEVLISVPVNAYGSTNIQKVEQDDTQNNTMIDCSVENLEELYGSTTIEELCGDILNNKNQYVYLYDLNERGNKQITVAVELRRFSQIDIGGEYVDISQLRERWNHNVGQYILENYIVSDGFWADRSIKLRANGDYYVFEITFTNIMMSQIDYISSKAKIVVLPGLAVNTVSISMPINWKKLLKTESITESVILNNMVYAKEEIAFLISYTGIRNRPDESNEDRDERILQAIKEYLSINELSAAKSQVEYFTETDMKLQYDIDIATASAGHVLVKFSYNSANTSKENYVSLPNGWIETNLENIGDSEYEEVGQIMSTGAQSVRYEVLLDNTPPLAPEIIIEGTLGNNDWYTSNVILNLLASKNDMIAKDGKIQIGGSGLYKNTLKVEGATKVEEQEINNKELSQNGISYAEGKAYDYVGNVSTTESLEIKIDQEKPTAPVIKLEGTPGYNGWYKTDVVINIIPGTDNVSGVDKTTYEIKGANAREETDGTVYRITKDGKSTIVATTYDKAGNSTSTEMDVYVDTSIPPEATITVVEGDKNLATNDWYKTPVTLRIDVNADQSVSGLGTSSYKITGSSEVPVTQFEGNTKEITISTNGTHYVTVYTYTQAGNFKSKEYIVKIDMDAPNAPTVLSNGTKGENGWYTSNVEVTVTSNGDQGTSSEKMMAYTLTPKGQQESEIRTEIINGGKIKVDREGEYILNVYSIDNALNEVKNEPVEIKIDKTAPIPAEFVINGTQGKDGWYISDVYLTHQGATDNVSGIQSVKLSNENITNNTTGTKVTLTTKDNAGHSVTKEITIKLDKSVPTAPVINLDKQPTGNGPFGAQIYNEYVAVTITPGEDYFIPGMDNLDKNTLEVTDNNGNVLLEEKETTSFEIKQEGLITVTARAYDKAGNVTIASKVIWIEIPKPETPKIVSINGTAIGNTLNKEVEGISNIIKLGVDNLTVGNGIEIVLINQETKERTVISKLAPDNGLLDIQLNSKGTYSIKVKQTNMYGTESNESEGLYLYTYQ